MVYEISQEELAELLGELDKFAISRVETGERQLDPWLMMRFILATRVSADWIYFGFLDPTLELPIRAALEKLAPELVRFRPAKPRPVPPAAARRSGDERPTRRKTRRGS